MSRIPKDVYGFKQAIEARSERGTGRNGRNVGYGALDSVRGAAKARWRGGGRGGLAGARTVVRPSGGGERGDSELVL